MSATSRVEEVAPSCSAEVAFFPGRFQPPHIGHLLTMRRLRRKYQRVIVGVTEAQPNVLAPAQVVDLLKSLLPDPGFEFVLVIGSIELGTAILPDHFDVCCSGNFAVLDRLRERGYRTEYVERSVDSLFSGTRERDHYVHDAVVSRALRASTPICEFSICETRSLRPIEQIGRRHFGAVEAEILEDGVMNRPLIVDRQSMAVLDGSHRYAFLIKHGFRLAPALLCDYDDESVFVGNHLAHRFERDSTKWITKQDVRATAITGNLYPPRTTRHFFPFRKIDIPTQLADLNQGEIASIEALFGVADPEGEIRSNNLYIDELRAEAKILSEYVEEQRGVMEWLREQNRRIARQAGLR